MDLSPILRWSMKIFYFWEQKSNTEMPAYLQMCVEIWRKNAPGAEIIQVDYSNLSSFVGEKVSPRKLQTFSLASQSDYVAVAVMSRNEGLFLDIDTIILPGFSLEAYSSASLSLYGNLSKMSGHSTSFFFSAGDGHPLLVTWLAEQERRIELENTGIRAFRWWQRRMIRGKHARVGWDYLGNNILDPLIRNPEMQVRLDLRDSVERGFVIYPRFGFQEPTIDSYLKFWLQNHFEEKDVIAAAKDKVLALQNSWTPADYKALSRQEILHDNRLLSRVLRAALSES